MVKTKTKVIVIGGGGHARVLIDAMDTAGGYKILGYTDMRSCTGIGIPYLGTDEAILKHSPRKVMLANGLGSVDRPLKRRQVYVHFRKLGYCFASVIHPSAAVSPRSSLAQGVQIMAMAVVNTGTRVGENVLINTSASIDHDCVIGEHAHAAPGVVLSGGVHIGACAHVATGAKIIQGIRVGSEALVGAGAVVVHDVPAKVKVFGVPARRKGK